MYYVLLTMILASALQLGLYYREHPDRVAEAPKHARAMFRWGNFYPSVLEVMTDLIHGVVGLLLLVSMPITYIFATVVHFSWKMYKRLR